MDSILNYIKGIAFLIIMITFVSNILPNSSYKKYIKIFTGLVLIITITKPMADFLGIGETFFESFSKYNNQFNSQEFESCIEEIQNSIVDEYIDEETSNTEYDESNETEYNSTEININIKGIN